MVNIWLSWVIYGLSSSSWGVPLWLRKPPAMSNWWIFQPGPWRWHHPQRSRSVLWGIMEGGWSSFRWGNWDQNWGNWVSTFHWKKLSLFEQIWESSTCLGGSCWPAYASCLWCCEKLQPGMIIKEWWSTKRWVKQKNHGGYPHVLAIETRCFLFALLLCWTCPIVGFRDHGFVWKWVISSQLNGFSHAIV